MTTKQGEWQARPDIEKAMHNWSMCFLTTDPTDEQLLEAALHFQAMYDTPPQEHGEK